ncbi:unnamed protein product [Rhizophagus irregularis]|nr:unnamed protein product [Rhizophagus irregularis]
MVILEGFKKKLCEYFTFSDGTENEHIIIGHIVDGTSLKRKISTGKMHKKLDQASSSSQSASDMVEIVAESQQPFSSYTFSKMKVLFGLKADSYDQLPYIEIGSSATPKEIRNSVIRHPHPSLATYRLDDQNGDTIISVTKAKQEDINQGVAQSTVQAHASLQCNHKKCTYDDTNLYEGVMYCIVSTDVDWAITKVQSGIGDGNDNSDGNPVFLCSPTPTPLPINYQDPEKYI